MNAKTLKKIFTLLILFIITAFTANATTPGPDYIYECPKCSNLLKKGSIMSGNTIGSTLYSDGKMIAPMLPEFPNLTKCKKCDTILWLSEMKEVGTCESNDKCKKEWVNADWAEFLDVVDLFRFLELDIVKNNKEKERIIRQQIWWTFNGRLRNNKEIFVKENDEVLFKQNCYRLIELFDTTDINQKIMTAELRRNLGEFDMCMEIVNSLGKDFDWITEKFKKECEIHNKFLIKLS